MKYNHHVASDCKTLVSCGRKISNRLLLTVVGGWEYVCVTVSVHLLVHVCRSTHGINLQRCVIARYEQVCVCIGLGSPGNCEEIEIGQRVFTQGEGLREKVWESKERMSTQKK